MREVITNKIASEAAETTSHACVQRKPLLFGDRGKETGWVGKGWVDE